MWLCSSHLSMSFNAVSGLSYDVNSRGFHLRGRLGEEESSVEAETTTGLPMMSAGGGPGPASPQHRGPARVWPRTGLAPAQRFSRGRGACNAPEERARRERLVPPLRGENKSLPSPPPRPTRSYLGRLCLYRQVLCAQDETQRTSRVPNAAQ